MARGNYYVEALDTRDNGKTYGIEIGRQVKTFKAARKLLDDDGRRGYVQVWSDRTQQRTIAAERRPDGSWFTVNPFNGEVVELV